MQRYNPKEIEPKWQQDWATHKADQATDFDATRPKYVMLTEFPYPSGDGLHIGHVREYTYGDIIARYKRMQGFNVMYPMGWDAFGLPTENYAIKKKVAPQIVTAQNVANFKAQMTALGLSFDWDREINTTDPEYYKWTQWLFLQFFKHGLAYQEETAINWCPHCKTGLANEEVVNGRHERCDTLVEKKFLKQWLLRITQYAERLIEGLKTVEYPSRIADQQINWIGKSTGAEIEFTLPTDLSGKSFLFLHAFKSNPNEAFWPGLKSALESRGATVYAPELPDAFNPDIEAQAAYVRTHYQLTEETTIITHSLGGVLAMKLLETADVAIDKLVLAGTPIRTDDFLDGKRRPELEVSNDWVFDYEAIRHKANEIVVLSSSNDNVVPASHGELLAKNLKARYLNVPTTKPHFNGTYELSVSHEAIQSVTVFTTRPDTIYGATFLVLAPEHPMVQRITTAEHKEHVNTYIRTAQGKTDVERQNTDREKTGVFTGAYATNPTTGQPVPIWVADYVLYGYGTGAIMAVPAHDERDWAFAHTHSLPVVRVVSNQAADDACSHDEGVMMNSGPYDGQPSALARERIVTSLAEQGLAVRKVNFKLRDWIFSRQHYWGEPIPIVHCTHHGAVAVPEDQLPVTLPEVEHYEPTDTGESPLAAITDWVNTTCPQCGGPAKRETDTMPNWAGSSWYYLRYFDTHNDRRFVDQAKLNYWQDVDLYLGGMEHTTLHLLYSRFWHQFLYDQGLVPTPEPYKARRGQGIILAADGSKMSKSKGNVINPTDVIASGYGADALRLAIAFLAPYDQTTPWNPESVAGTYRFLNRLWVLTQEFKQAADADAAQDDAVGPQLLRITHKAIKKVGTDIDNLDFNTAISAMMEAVNDLYKLKAEHGLHQASWQPALESMTRILSPYAPHISEELWHELGHTGSVHATGWPQYDEQYLVQDTISLAVQVNGKLRDTIQVAPDADQATAETAARASDNVQAFLAGTVVKVIYVPGRILNFVAK